MDVSLLTIVNSVRTAAEMGVAVMLFASPLPRRGHFVVRAVAFLAVLALFIALCMGQMDEAPESQFLPVIMTYAVVLVYCAVAVPLLFEAGMWQALYCTTAGYTMQNLASGLGGFWMYLLRLWGITYQGTLLSLATMVAIYVACYLLLVRRIQKGRLYIEESHAMLTMMLVVICAVIGFDVAVKAVSVAPDVSPDNVFMLRVTHAVVCCFVLYAEFEMMHNSALRSDMAAMRQLAADERRQYELSRETIQSINARVHDIRHRVLGMLSAQDAGIGRATVASIAREMDVYDARVVTGNEALDVILTERSLLCEHKGIRLACMADGTAVAFMRPSEVYSFFGNALDCAIEVVEGQPDKERRRVALDLRGKMGVTSVHVEGYFDGMANLDDRSPALLSMRRMAESYGGTLVSSAAGDVFMIDAMIPQPSEAAS